MKSIKYLVVLVCITLGMADVAKAQIYCDEIVFYANTENENDMYQVKFLGEEVRMGGDSRSTVRSNLLKSQSFYEYDKDYNKCERRTYCYDKSTSSREVYKGHRWVQKPGAFGYSEGEGWKYYAFSSDKSSLIIWEEKPNNYDGTIHKEYYVRVSLEDLLPKAVNYDFLND